MSGLQIIYLILALINSITTVIASITYFIANRKYQTVVNRLIFFYFVCFGATVGLDSLRFFWISLTGYYVPVFDIVGNYFKIFAILIAFVFIVQLHLQILKNANFKIKGGTFLLYYQGFLAVFLTFYYAFTFYQTISNSFGFYLFQFDITAHLISIILYCPFIIVIFFANRQVSSKISNKKVILQSNIFTMFSIFLTIERILSLGLPGLLYFWYDIHLDISIFIDNIFLAIILIGFIFFLIKYPDFLESIGSYFSIKSIFIISNSGQLLYEHNFESCMSYDALSSENSLIGGFIFAISEGMKELLRLEGGEEIHSFSSKNRSVLIRHGRYSFGVLIVTEDSKLFHEKLISFITEFEKSKSSVLANWTGEITNFLSEDIQKLMRKHLREE
ncbi:MAG: hypothetical protein EAX96_17110 [Candidatus Lokiarchaeota archaeon]|nr:hypothetical protein [Candidatus Lokiarchaeota archaeon]